MKSMEEKFFKKVQKTHTCWLWIGAMAGGRSGDYGVMRNSAQKMDYAHRISYELFKGAIPKGFQIDHLCRVRRCVKPEHLDAVTCQENLLRGAGSTASNAIKTHCKRGHEFSPDNSYIQIINGKPKRSCKICRCETVKACYRKRAAQQ